jgi:hypothetical protein
VPICEGKRDFRLELSRELLEAIDHFRIAARGLDQVLNLLWRHATPGTVRAEIRSRLMYSPVTILPARMLLDGDLDSISELALLDLDFGVLAFLIGAASTLVGRFFCGCVSLDGRNKA